MSGGRGDLTCHAGRKGVTHSYTRRRRSVVAPNKGHVAASHERERLMD